MTVVYKNVDSRQRTGEEVVLGIEKQTRRLLFHQRLKSQSVHKEASFKFPLEIFLLNPQVMLHHNIADPQLAICSASVLPLFADNFDFENRDDFVKGLLINEEILDSRIYVNLLPNGEYAARVSNWQTYQMIR
jgi:translation initiation factor eIF-2B subunit epsilon